MKIGRNDPCPCGSGKKYKHCCFNAAKQQSVEINDELSHILATNPSLTIEDLNVVAQHKMGDLNHRPIDDFCGLSPTLMSNWLYAPLNELDLINIQVPADLTSSPVMQYLSLIIDEAMEQGGSFKLTPKGNLPTKIVKKASELLPKFSLSKYETINSMSEFIGSNEDKFNALHYTRVLADLAGIFYKKSGRLHIRKTAQKQFQTAGVNAFFLPMLEATIKEYNWGYFDGWSDAVELSPFVFFMLWRVQSHGSLERLIQEVETAFPDILKQVPNTDYDLMQDTFAYMVESRFINRFLGFWGFAILNPRVYEQGKKLLREIEVLPLFHQTFKFDKSL